MAEQSHLNDELNEFAAALRALKPVESRINRDRLMYEAGRAAAVSQPPSRWQSIRTWRYLTALSTAVAACLAVLLAYDARPSRDSLAENPDPPRGSQASVDVVMSAPSVDPMHDMLPSPAIDRELSAPEYLRLRNLVVANGVDQLPESTPQGGESSGASSGNSSTLSPRDSLGRGLGGVQSGLNWLNL